MSERTAEVVAHLPNSRSAGDDRVVASVSGREIVVALDPEPGVVCDAELPGLDGYALAITPGRQLGDDGLGYISFDSLGTTHNDRELTRTLIGDDVRDELVCLYRVRRVLALVGERVLVVGEPLPPPELAAVVGAVARLCARPYELADRVARRFRRLGGIASGDRWNTVDYHIAISTAPTVRIDWPRLPGRGLVTRFHVESTVRDDPFRVVDTRRAHAPRGGASVPLAIPGGRMVCVAADGHALTAACARLDRVLPQIGAALPTELVATPSAVEVLYAGFEEQNAALEPAITLVRLLAGPSTHAPYR